MNSELCLQLLNLEPGAHLCLFYEKDPVEQMPALIPFIQEGLCRDEQLIYIADDQTVEELENRLKQGGINVAMETGKERLKLWTRREWRQPGRLDSAQKLRQVRRFIDQAFDRGFKGIRFAMEMTWTLGPDISGPDLERWEAALNTVFVPGFPGCIVCQYNRRRLDPEVMLAALHTHPVAILDERARPNLFYEPPLMLKGKGNGHGNRKARAADRVEWMIHQLRRAGVAGNKGTELLQENSFPSAEETVDPSQDEHHQRAALEASVAQLTEANTQLEAFIYSIAHDLRAPLRSMQAFSSMLLEDCALQLDETAKDYARRIAGCAASMDSLVVNLLAYSRMARSEIRLHAVDLKTVWAAALAQNEQIINEKSAQVEAASPLPGVRAHETPLTQVLANLLNNALKFVQPGVVPRVRLWAEERAGMIRLWMEDNGIGIPPQHEQRVFRIFERLHGPGYSGTGIGLSIVRKGVERMGGRVGVESKHGHGSRFWVELLKA